MPSQRALPVAKEHLQPSSTGKDSAMVLAEESEALGTGDRAPSTHQLLDRSVEANQIASPTVLGKAVASFHPRRLVEVDEGDRRLVPVVDLRLDHEVLHVEIGVVDARIVKSPHFHGQSPQRGTAMRDLLARHLGRRSARPEPIDEIPVSFERDHHRPPVRDPGKAGAHVRDDLGSRDSRRTRSVAHDELADRAPT